MSSPGPSSVVARFDVFEVDLRAGELYKAGRKIKLQVLPFQALAILLERPGEVVTRKEFEKRLWPGDTFVDFDHSLNTAIKKLRLALGDDNKKPRFVETLPKRGYRFIGTVEPAAKISEPVKAPAAASRVGQVAKLRGDDALSFTLVSVDEETAAEREKLDAANDDVGLSLLIASQKLLMVPGGTQVRILEAQPTQSRCQVRILEGEHYGKAAVVPLKQLAEFS
ncbi:MAG TPA: winged helix-turn-helix domain-containing protein [Candidatus Acidoferrum sp.]|nr:winged helix-turn-helix domain-containing protein [Candidatus Acidoferrum sp.]